MKKGDKVDYVLLAKEKFVFFYSYKNNEIWKRGNYRIVINIESQTIIGIFEIVPGGSKEVI